MFYTSSIDSRLLGKKLKGLIKGDVFYDKVTRLLYSTDASIYRIVPSVVVCPRDEEDVIRLAIFARETSIPLTARGAGTGLAGESLTGGIVLDFSRYMTSILECNLDEGWVKVQPGVILDEINKHTQPYGLQFGPDPSSGSRATVGGSVSNNATGAHSLRYGYCSDNLMSLNVVLADGRLINTGDKDWIEIESQLYKMLGPHRRIIAQHWPKVSRNRAGYNIQFALDNNRFDLLKLFPGAEGTLGIFTQAKLKLVSFPKTKLVLSVNFDDMILMGKSLSIILEYDPSAVELMDEGVLKLARSADRELSAILPEAVASLMIEFDSDNYDEALDRLKRCCERLAKEFSEHVWMTELTDPNEQKKQWIARKNAVPLLFRQQRAGKPVPLIEDIAVGPEKMPEYLAGLQEIFDKYELDASYYAHAGAGELHIRPFLDLHNIHERKKLSSLGKEVFELVWSLGGTISGEHGIGIARSWALRKQYGQAYDFMEQIKYFFDPSNVLNPGKIIVTDTDLPLENLRDDLFAIDERNRSRLYLDNDVFYLADVCSGCGQCKSFESSQLMCPVFRAVGDEYSSPRAKANLMREYLSGMLDDVDLLSHEAGRVLDSCLLCGNCLRDCPSAVQIPQMIVELRTRRNELKDGKFVERFFANSEYMEWVASKFAPISNFVMSRKGMQRMMELAVGIDSRRPMPAFSFPGTLNSLRKLAKKYEPANPKYQAIWFVDLFARYHNLQLAEDIAKVCGRNGIKLIVPEQCGVNMPAFAYGYFDEARKSAAFNIEEISHYINQADMILSFEPTATLCLKSEYKQLLDDSRLDAISEKTRDGCEFLYQLFLQGELESGNVEMEMKIAYHCPCHLRLLEIGQLGFELLKTINGVIAERLPDNCCGLGGTYGMQKEKYEISESIARSLSESIGKGDYEALVSECGACRMQLEHISGLPSYHPVSILARCYG